MRFDSRGAFAALVVSVIAALSPVHSEGPASVHRQRYSMGTMVDVIVYHASRDEAERAVAGALDEIVALDRVMSHFRADSDLASLVRGARGRFVTVDPRLYDVIERSLGFSRASGGRFDVTIAPLLKLWKVAKAEARRPSEAEMAKARQCVGFEKIELGEPNRIRFHSDCVEIDLGGIGKGYAVERAIGILEAAGIRHAMINAGGSSIAAIGTPPARNGWPVRLGAAETTVLLQNASLSTSEQNGEILEPGTGAPVENKSIVSVVAPSASDADALSTALLLMPKEDGLRLLERFPRVSAVWTSPSGELKATYGDTPIAR